MRLDEFRASLTQHEPHAGISAASVALWWAGRSDGERTHSIAQGDPTAAGSWIYAYLHCADGDASDAL